VSLLCTANSASVVVIFFKAKEDSIHQEYGLKWEKEVNEEQNKRKDTFRLEVETESICLIVSDRVVPQTLSSLNKVDLLLTICRQIPNKHSSLPLPLS